MVLPPRAASELPDQLATLPADKSKIVIGVDDINAGQNKSKALTQQQAEIWYHDPVLQSTINSGQTSFTDPFVAGFARRGDWVIASAFSLNAEMRRITNVSGSTISVSQAFKRTHAVNQPVQVSRSGKRNVRYWGAQGQKTVSAVPAIQAAMDDFESVIQAGASPTGNVETAANEIFFSDGQFLIDKHVQLPIITPYNTSQQVVRGENAQIVTTSFNGPFFSHRYTGTHDGPNNATVLVDSTQNWAVDSLIGGFIFNLTDGSHATITDNDATTVTHDAPPFGPLQGGLDNDWDTGDSYLIVVFTSKWMFKDLVFRDETAAAPSAGTAHIFDWAIFRNMVHNCTFSRFDAVWKSLNTQNDARQYIQQPIVTNNFFDSCRAIFDVAKIWKLSFMHNETDSVPNIVHCLATGGAALIKGTIFDNTIQGAGAGSAFRIRGARRLTVEENYIETVGTNAAPIFDFTLGQQPQSISIKGNQIALSPSQLADHSYYPIQINPIAEGVVVQENTCDGANLLDPGTMTKDSRNWVFGPNNTIHGRYQSSMEHWGNRSRNITRLGFRQTTTALPTAVGFGHLDGPCFSAGDFKRASTIMARAHVTAVNSVNRVGSANAAVYDFWAYYQWKTLDNLVGDTVELRLVGVEKVLAFAEDVGPYNATFLHDHSEGTFTVDPTFNKVLSTAHGLTNGEAVYLAAWSAANVLGTLPGGFTPWISYYVQNTNPDDFQLSRSPNPNPAHFINITSSGVGHTQKWYQDDIHVQVTGEASGQAVDWTARVEIQANQS